MDTTVRADTDSAGLLPPQPIERASAADLMELAGDRTGAPMQVGAILVLGPVCGLDLTAVREVMADRVRAVPRLRQRLVRAPLGCGRPVWVDDSGFDIHRHVRSVDCPAPGDQDALLALAAEMITSPLPSHQPLWLATMVTGLAGGGTALIVVFHHVLADGIGGLAVLAQLVDGAPAVPIMDFPRPPPTPRQLFADAVHTRLAALTRLPAGARQLRAAIAELGTGTPRPPSCSLNRPTGPQRALALARADLAAVHTTARAHGATVNDVMLTAVAGALRTLLRRRGETINSIVVSVPVSLRRSGSITRLGNQVGVMPVAIPTTGDPIRRLAAIARITSSRKATAPDASMALLGPIFRFMAQLGLLHRFIDRQRMITTLLTNLHGPDTRLSFLGAPVISLIPVSQTTGNVTVAFAVLSYAGTLVTTITSDPQHCPDLSELAAELHKQLNALAHLRPGRLALSQVVDVTSAVGLGEQGREVVEADVQEPSVECPC
jgi:diacylglycerol O-acyltransferase / wax synthase